MKIQTLEKIIKNKSIKKEFAIITNLQNGSSEVYEPGKKLSEEFSKFTFINFNNLICFGSKKMPERFNDRRIELGKIQIGMGL